MSISSRSLLSRFAQSALLAEKIRQHAPDEIVTLDKRMAQRADDMQRHEAGDGEGECLVYGNKIFGQGFVLGQEARHSPRPKKEGPRP